MDKILKVNQGQVIHETFDDEIVIVNLDTGSYYSLAQTSAAIWQMLVQGATSAQIQEYIAASYEGDRAEMARTVQGFLDELVADGLVGETVQSAANEKIAAMPNIARAPFQAPVLNKYTDMEELLLLDPIHEVDELGWPRAKSDSPE